MDKGKRHIVDEEDEEEPIQIAGEFEVTDETVSQCLLGKLWTEKPYNTYGLFETMKKSWCRTIGMICREMWMNIISFQFHNKIDLDRVLAMEPWQFNKHVLVLSPLSGETQPSKMQFNKTPFWMWVYDVPMVGMTNIILRQIRSHFGEVLEIDSTTLDGFAKSVRIRVVLHLSKPIKQGTKIRIGTAQPYRIPITYERLLSFCYWCGMFGHTTKDYDKLQDMQEKQGNVTEESMPYGDFLNASPMKFFKSETSNNGKENKFSEGSCSKATFKILK